jgi:DnaJ-class molecular chaperone
MGRVDVWTMGYPRRAMAADEQTPEPLPCSPCRGTGQVISNLGGSPSTLVCPWCEGTGTFIPEHDAQAARREA